MSGNLNIITIQQLQDHISNYDNLDIIKVKPNIPHKVKVELVKQISNACLYVENSITKIDFCQKDYMVDLAIVEFGTNIKDDFTSENYDILNDCGAIDFIISIAKKDYLYLTKQVDKTLEQELSLANRIETVAQKELAKVSDKIVDLLDEKTVKRLIAYIPKQVNKIDKDKLGFMQQGFNMLKDMLNKQKVAG